MRVQPILVGPEEYNYLVIGSDGLPCEYPAKYMKYLQSIQSPPETRRTYSKALRFFYEFLEISGIPEFSVNVKVLSDFMIWLEYPGEFGNVSGIRHINPIRSERTINLYITSIISYYRFLYVTYNDELRLDDSIYFAKHGPRKYKDFLYHVTKNRAYKKSILKVKEPKEKSKKRLSEEEIRKCLSATQNIRDHFLLYLLLTTGLRIGEALSLFHEDIFQDSYGSFKIHIANRRNNDNQAFCKTGSRDVLMSQECLDLYDDYCFFLECTSGISSNYVFVKISGDNVGAPLDKPCVYSLFRRIKHKTNIDVHPHLFRSTYGSILYGKTNDIEFVRESLGHASIQTTIDAYVEITDEEVLTQWNKVKDSFLEENNSNGQ